MRSRDDWIRSTHRFDPISKNYGNSLSPAFRPLVRRYTGGYQVCMWGALRKNPVLNKKCLRLHKSLPNLSSSSRSKTRRWFLQQYHKRSNVESTFSMIKAKFGDSLRSKTETAQVNEALCKVPAHNICCLIQSMSELKIKPEFWTEVTVN